MDALNLMIFGAETYLGMEVARLGRAMGHRIAALTTEDPPPLQHRWMAGVSWSRATALEPARWPREFRPYAAIYCATTHYDDAQARQQRRNIEAVRALIEARTLAKSRIVYRSAAPTPLVPSTYLSSTRQAEALLAAHHPDHVSARLPLLYGSDRPDSALGAAIVEVIRALRPRRYARPMRVETAAIALLRAALEPHHRGVLDAPEIATLGDALFAQTA